MYCQAEESTKEGFLRGGDAEVSFRYRYANVDDDRFSEEARASTVRSRLSLSSGRVSGFRLVGELDNVSEIGADDFNEGMGNTPSRTQYPVVADPNGTEVNQAYIEFQKEGLTARGGRQRINYDNQRFVGGVAWRQNEQTYDGVKFDYAADKFTIPYAAISRVSRIFGDDVPAGEHEQDGTHLLNVSGNAGTIGKISGYYYIIDNEDASAFSTDTIGVRLTGKQSLDSDEDLSLRYTAEFARQSENADNPISFNANYWTFDGGIVFGKWDLGLGWEVLEGDRNSPGQAFRTPLGTNHAFNGWADLFLTTPAAGLDDRYLKAKFTQGKSQRPTARPRFRSTGRQHGLR